MLVSFMLPGHGYSGAYEVDISVRIQQPAEMTFNYPLVL